LVNSKDMKNSRELFEMFNIINKTNAEKPVEGKVRYKALGARNLMEALQLNGFSINRNNDASAGVNF